MGETHFGDTFIHRFSELGMANNTVSGTLSKMAQLGAEFSNSYPVGHFDSTCRITMQINV